MAPFTQTEVTAAAPPSPDILNINDSHLSREFFSLRSWKSKAAALCVREAVGGRKGTMKLVRGRKIISSIYPYFKLR
jgi:hypothetical protein